MPKIPNNKVPNSESPKVPAKPPASKPANFFKTLADNAQTFAAKGLARDQKAREELAKGAQNILDNFYPKLRNSEEKEIDKPATKPDDLTTENVGLMNALDKTPADVQSDDGGSGSRGGSDNSRSNGSESGSEDSTDPKRPSIADDFMTDLKKGGPIVLKIVVRIFLLKMCNF